MQYPYALRRFSSWSFRLSVGMALLLSSIGLAASLLLGSTVRQPSLPRVGWKPFYQFSQPANQLATGQRASAQALPVSLSSLVSGYSPAIATVYNVPLAGPISEVSTPPAETAQASAGTFKSTVQRYWTTFKLAFR